ncbi:MAG TPA: hypothetical protein PLP13_02345 [bacterium]|nr:hypothetical protein [bacterium]HOL49404.1 hypothetical protein [bacterium]
MCAIITLYHHHGNVFKLYWYSPHENNRIDSRTSQLPTPYSMVVPK